VKFSPHINYNGRCLEAFKHYAEIFGGRITMQMTYGESPAACEMPADMAGKIIHAEIDIGGPVLMGADAPPDRFSAPQGIQLSVSIDKPADAERIFNALAQGGAVIMPFQQTFWAHRFGMCADRFGISWMVNCEKAA
jgi:PhnB protein